MEEDFFMNSTKQIGYVGTYTKENSEGIYAFTLDTQAGKITDVKLAAKIDNPTYLAVSKNNKFLYSVVKDGHSGGIAAFRISSSNGQLTYLNREVSEGAPPCHVSVSEEGGHVFSANYHKGTVESFSVKNDSGSITPPISVIQHSGAGHDERQEKPHTHYAGPTPDEKYIVVVDLGIDKIITYEVNQGVLLEKNSLSVKPGSGPRHLEFHPNGKFAYVMTEFSSEVLLLNYNAIDGSFTQVQTISTLPENFSDNNQGSAIHISADGRFLYAGNRGHDSIALFSISQETGELSFIEHTSTEGSWPRDFELDPTGQFIVASNQQSNSLALFSRDAMTGRLTLLQKDIAVPEPVCVKFLKN